MITILTQNKKNIIDCQDIFISENQGYKIVNKVGFDGTITYLGEYNTEERAISVINMIFQTMLNGGTIAIMPEK